MTNANVSGADICEINTISPSNWIHTGAVTGTTTLAFGSAGQSGGSTTHPIIIDELALNKKHTFDFGYGINSDGPTLTIRVDVFEGGNIISTEEFSTSLQAITRGTIEFYPSSENIDIVITDVVGNANRDIRVVDIEVTSTCEDRPEQICVNLAETTATAENTSGQPAGNSLFRLEFNSDIDSNPYFNYDSVTGILSGNTGDYSLEIEGSFVTAGTANTIERTYWFRDVGNGSSTGTSLGEVGKSGQGNTQTPASVTIPANTSYSYDVRVNGSSGNQRVQVGSYIRVKVCGEIEDIANEFLNAEEHDEVTLTQRAIDQGYSLNGQELDVPDCHTGNYTNLLFNEDGLVNVYNYNADAANTIDNATATQAQISAVLDAFDYTATPDNTTTQADLSYVDFETGAGTESNISVIEGYIKVDAGLSIRTRNSSNHAVRIEIGQDLGDYVTVIDHFNGPNGAAASPGVGIPTGIHKIRITAFDYDGVNGSFDFQTDPFGASFVTGITGIELISTPPTKDCFVGRVCAGSTDVTNVDTGLVVSNAELLCIPENEEVQLDPETCDVLSNMQVNYNPLQFPLPATGIGGISNLPVANEVILQNQAVGESNTKILEFDTGSDATFKIEAKFTVVDAGGNLNYTTGGGFGFSGGGVIGRSTVEFTSLERDENGDLIPFSIAVAAASFQTSDERWWADGTSTVNNNLTAVDTFVLPNNTIGTYPATGIFGTTGADQAARLIAYEDKTFVRAQWNTAASAGSSISLILYKGPETVEANLCEIKDRLDTKINTTANVLREEMRQPIQTDELTGIYELSTHSALPDGINTSTDAAGTNIITGHDFTQGNRMTLRLHIRDQANNQAWGVAEIDVDNMLDRFNAGSGTDGWVTFFDNDYVIINIVDPATGEISIRDVGRDFEYIKSELIAPATSTAVGLDQSGTVETWNAGTVLTTTNGVSVNPGSQYIQFPNGTSYASDSPDELVDTFILGNGGVNAETIVGFLPERVARNFTATGDTGSFNFTTATTIINGELDNSPTSPLEVPKGATGYVYRDTGNVTTIVYQTVTANSVVLKSPDGTDWNITIDDSGGLVTNSI